MALHISHKGENFPHAEPLSPTGGKEYSSISVPHSWKMEDLMQCNHPSEGGSYQAIHSEFDMLVLQMHLSFHHAALQ